MDPNEHSNRFCGIPPGMPLEDLPRGPIAVLHGGFPLDSGRDGQNPSFTPPWVSGPSRTGHCERGKPKVNNLRNCEDGGKAC